MKFRNFLKMSQGKIMEGVFAINKPTGISSAQVIRDLQKAFEPSALFSPYLSAERAKRDEESRTQRGRRKQKKVNVKIGHGGTLDPLATGVLITGIGKGTKSLGNFLECTKTYEAVVLFGTSTDSYDRFGKVLKRAPYEHVTRELVEGALSQFRGRFMQLPPLFSALKMNGKPLYEYAREGKELPREIERRPVDVTDLEMVEWMEGGTHEHKAPTDEADYHEINLANKLWKQEGVQPAVLDEFESKKRKFSDEQDDLVVDRPPPKKGKPFEVQEAEMSGGLGPAESTAQAVEAEETTEEPRVGPPAARLRMTVTSGFYVRSLCHDLGAAVRSAAIMAELERSRQGDFEVGKNVLEYEDLAKGEKVWAPKVEQMLENWTGIHTSAPLGSKRGLELDRNEAVQVGAEIVDQAEKRSPRMDGSGIVQSPQTTDGVDGQESVPGSITGVEKKEPESRKSNRLDSPIPA